MADHQNLYKVEKNEEVLEINATTGYEFAISLLARNGHKEAAVFLLNFIGYECTVEDLK